MIFTCNALLMPAFSLPLSPRLFPVTLHRLPERSPTLLTLELTPSPMNQPEGCFMELERRQEAMASVPDLIPGGLSALKHIRPVSYYALFKGWLLLSQPPGCLCVLTS